MMHDAADAGTSAAVCVDNSGKQGSGDGRFEAVLEKGTFQLLRLYRADRIRRCSKSTVHCYKQA